MDGVYYELKNKYAVETTRGFGVYYDNPREVPGEQCRSIAGCIVETGDLDKIEKVKEKYFVREYPSAQAVVTEFPFRGKMAIFIGIMKAYPLLGKYMEEKSYTMCPSLEIYDMLEKKIIYAMSIGLNTEVFDAFLKPKPEPVEEEEGPDTLETEEKEG